MRKFVNIFLTIVFSSVSFAQVQNVELLGSLNPASGSRYNDCWGYVDESGREYALIGSYYGTHIVDVTDPKAPVTVSFIEGPPSSWRDIKTHDKYAYIVTEGKSAGNGLQIVDLSKLPASAALVKTVNSYFQSAHNIYIDNGYAYVIGTNTDAGGMQILNLKDPVNPVRSSVYTASGYIHDVYVWNDTAIVSSENSYDLVDLSQKKTPALVSASPALPGIYAHSGWLTEDKRYFIAAEEFDKRDITVWDLNDRSSWELVVPEWQITKATPSDPVHNIFVKGNYAHISYYKHGYVVLDVSNPLQPQLVGQYDTYQSTGGTYEGAWGCYPYLPSGTVIISDINSGLYLFNFELDDPVVPVELTSFTAQTGGSSVLLNWITGSELNNKGFAVERSADESSWTQIGYVTGSGTTSELKVYSYIDKNPLARTSYYRLIQQDFNGDEDILKSVKVVFTGPVDFSMHQNYPNPFNPDTKIKYSVPSDGFINLAVYNNLGERVMLIEEGYKEAGHYEVSFNGSGLSSGVYFAKLQSGGETAFIKMSLIK